MRVSDVPGCNGCPFQRLFPNNAFVPPKVGTSDVAVVGEAPGEEEARLVEPFVGKSGNVLDGWFHKIGLTRHSLWMTNVLACRPKDNAFPTDQKARKYISSAEGREVVDHCWKAHLLPFLQSRKWEKVYLIGAKALDRVCEKTSLFKWGGSPLPIPALDPIRRVAIATLHPAGLMRDQSMYPFVFTDLQRSLEPAPEYYSFNPGVATLDVLGRGPFALDIETDVPPTKVNIVSLTNETYAASVFTYGTEFGHSLRELLANAREIVTQNGIQFDLPKLAAFTDSPTAASPETLVHWDTMLMHHLISPSLPHDLGSLGRQFCQKPYWKDWQEGGEGEERYAGRDVDVTWQVYLKLRPQLERHPRLLRLYHEVQVPLARICHLMTETGIMTDPAAALKMASTAEQVIRDREADLPESMRTAPPRPVRKRLDTYHEVETVKRKRRAAPEGTLSPTTGKPIKFVYDEVIETKKVYDYEVVMKAGASPWRNGPRTAEFLYKDLGLKTYTDATGKVTTGKKALALLFHTSQRKEVEAIREMRKWAHRKQICDKLKDGVAHRVHASFNVHGTETGRLSSSGGDDRLQLQNVTEEMRVVFVPSQPGWRIISIDFSQMEARLAAWFAKDTARAERFDRPGFNEYKYAASIFLGVPMAQVAKDKAPDSPYHRSKTVVLGVDRALGARKISLENDIPESEVKQMLATWKSEIPATMAWQEEVGNRAKRDKCLWNPFGRRGLFWGDRAYTQGISYLPQSTGADVIYRAMIALMYERIEWPRSWAERVARVVRPLPWPARLLLQIHDELVFEAPAEAVADVVGTCVEVMRQAWAQLDELALPVNAAVGENWFQLEDFAA